MGLEEVKVMASYAFQDDGRVSTFSGARSASRAEPVLALEREHETILRQSRALIEVSRHGRGNGKAHSYGENVERQFSKMKKLLTTHVRNEERLLLPIMSEYFDTEASDVIRSEHAEILGNLRKLSSRILELKRAQRPDKRLVMAATDFDSNVRAHFSREENVTYWFVNLCLSKKRGLRHE